MKNIITKFKINNLTYIVLLLSLLSGMFQKTIIVAMIIIVHELGHVLTALYFKCSITKVELFPFGGITKVEKDINFPINKEIVLALAGVLFQLLLGVVMFILTNEGFVRIDFYNTFILYNNIILIFNLIPIIPLDGNILIKSLLEKIFSYKNAYYINFFISCLFIIILIIFNVEYQLNNYMIITFLVYKMYFYLKEYRYYQNKFFLERYLNNYNFKKEYIVKNTLSMKKEKKHSFLLKNKIYSEKEILAKKFDINN